VHQTSRQLPEATKSGLYAAMRVARVATWIHIGNESRCVEILKYLSGIGHNRGENPTRLALMITERDSNIFENVCFGCPFAIDSNKDGKGCSDEGSTRSGYAFLSEASDTRMRT